MATYIIRPGDRTKSPLGRRTVTVPADALPVRFGRKYRNRRSVNIPGLGRTNMMEDDGVDEKRLDLRIDGSTQSSFRAADGTRPMSGWAVLRIGQDQVKAVIREMQKKDEEAIADLDDWIAATQAQLKALRQERAELVTKAWKRGGTVPAKTLEEKARQA